MLPYIVAFNQTTANEQLDFILADKDRKQWQVVVVNMRNGYNILFIDLRDLDCTYLNIGLEILNCD